MRFRAPTKKSLVYDGAAGAVGAGALSAALLSPQAFAYPLIGIAAITCVVLTPMSIARQRRGEVNFALVSASERRAYLVGDTALVFGMLLCLAVVFFLACTSYSAPIRVGLGHLALFLAALAGVVRARSTMAHAERICPRCEDCRGDRIGRSDGR